MWLIEKEDPVSFHDLALEVGKPQREIEAIVYSILKKHGLLIATDGHIVKYKDLKPSRRIPF